MNFSHIAEAEVYKKNGSIAIGVATTPLGRLRESCDSKYGMFDQFSVFGPFLALSGTPKPTEKRAVSGAKKFILSSAPRKTTD